MNRNFQFEILFIIANAPTFFIGLLNVCGGGSRSGIIKIIRNKHSILISRPNKQKHCNYYSHQFHQILLPGLIDNLPDKRNETKRTSENDYHITS